MSQHKPEQFLEQIESSHRYRIVEASAGTLITYLLWRAVYPNRIGLPYPAELSLPLELLWGALTGLGPFLGIAVAQTAHTVRKAEKPSWQQLIKTHWGYPLLGLLGGLLAGTAWWYLARWIHQESTSLIMTVIWAAVYTLVILLTPLTLNRPKNRDRYLTIGALALVPIIGFLITRWLHVDPDQADLDMTVGLFLRAALVIGTLLVVPNLKVNQRKPPKYPAAGEQITILFQTIAHRRKGLNKQGVRQYLGDKLGYSPNTIRKFCSGHRLPTKDTTLDLLKIGHDYGLDQNWGQRLLQATQRFVQTEINDELTRIFGPPPKEKKT